MARRTARQWARLVERWKRSGLSAREFGAKARVDYRSLHWWSWALAKRAAPHDEATRPSDETPAFLPVRLAQRDAPAENTAPATVEPVEVTVDARISVRVRPGFDEDTLKRVLAILRG